MPLYLVFGFFVTIVGRGMFRNWARLPIALYAAFILSSRYSPEYQHIILFSVVLILLPDWRPIELVGQYKPNVAKMAIYGRRFAILVAILAGFGYLLANK